MDKRVSASQLHNVVITLQNVSKNINEVENYLTPNQKANFEEAIIGIVNEIDNSLNTK